MLQLNTKNKTVLNTYQMLVKKSIRNADTIMQLNDPSLIDIDPHNPDLTDDQKIKICIECRDNPWYFFREVVRVASPKGNPEYFRMGAISVGAIFACLNNKDAVIEAPRQYGRVTMAMVLEAYSYFLNRSDSDEVTFYPNRVTKATCVHEYEKMKRMLPSYMIPAEVMGNYSDYVIPKCPHAANNAARRSMNMAVYVDAPYIKNFNIFYVTNATIWPMVKDIKNKKNDVLCSRIILVPPVTSPSKFVAGNMVTIDLAVEQSKLWLPTWLDATEEQLSQVKSFRIIKR